MPTASMATSAPRPPVSSRTIARGSSRPLFTVTSAPNSLAASSLESARSMATMWLGLNSWASDDGRETDGSGADDGDHVAGRHSAVEHADFVAVGQDVGEHEELLVADPGWDRVGRGVGERAPAPFPPASRRCCGRGSSRRRRGTARSGPRGRTGTCHRPRCTTRGPGHPP